MRSPFLKKIGIAFGTLGDLQQGFVVDFGPRLLDWPSNGLPHGVVTKRTHAAKIEETFCIALGLSGHCRELRQARSEHDHGKRFLADAMQGNDERTQVLVIQVLNLVHQNGHRLVGGHRGLSNRDQKVRQISFQVAGRGQARLRFHTHLEVCVGYPEGACEIAKGTKRTVPEDTSLLAPTQPIEDAAQLRDEKPRETLLLGGLDQSGQMPCGFRKFSDSDQKNGLPYTSEAEKHHALRVTSSLDPP